MGRTHGEEQQHYYVRLGTTPHAPLRPVSLLFLPPKAAGSPTLLTLRFSFLSSSFISLDMICMDLPRIQATIKNIGMYMDLVM